MSGHNRGMLILSRQASETIVIPELGITIMLTEIRKGKIGRIGVDADRKISVFRGEIWDKIQREDPELVAKFQQRCDEFIKQLPERLDQC